MSTTTGYSGAIIGVHVLHYETFLRVERNNCENYIYNNMPSRWRNAHVKHIINVDSISPLSIRAT